MTFLEHPLIETDIVVVDPSLLRQYFWSKVVVLMLKNGSTSITFLFFWVASEVTTMVKGLSNAASSNRLDNFIDGKFVTPEGVTTFVPVVSPSDETVIAQVPLSTAANVDEAVAAAKRAFPEWSGLTIKQRAGIMMKFHHLMDTHSQELAELIVRENGKNLTEALADVAKGNETVEWAASLPQVAPGRVLEVSKGISCQELRNPLGVVAAIVPFNFPGMYLSHRAMACSCAGVTAICVPVRSDGTHVDDSDLADRWQLRHLEAFGEGAHHDATYR